MPYSNKINFQSPNVFAAQELLNQQQQKMAQGAYMHAQEAQPLQGKNVGNVYVPPSWTQQLAQALQAPMARAELDRANTGMLDIANRKRQAYSNELKQFGDLMNGTPEQTLPPTTPNDDEGNINAPINVAAQAPDRSKALAYALGAQNPMLQQFGGELAKREFMPKESKWEKSSTYNPDGSIIHGYVDMNSKNPETTFRPMGGSAEPLKGVVINGQLSHPITGAPMGTAVPKQEDAPNPRTELLVKDPVTGKLIPNAPLIDAKKSISKAGAPNVQTVVNTGQKAFEGELGKLDAKQLGDWRDTAQTAQNTLATISNMREAEKAGTYSGGGANAKLAAANLLEGFTGITPKGLVGSQLYNAEASKLVLDHVKALGANPSNADRAFIEKTVPQLSSNSAAREKMANWIEQKATQAIKNFENADAYARENHGLGGYKPLIQPTKPTAPQGGAKFLGFE